MRVHSWSLLCCASALALAACEPEGPSCQPAAGTICTVAGTGRAGYSGDLGPAHRAALYLPMDTEIGPDGRVYLVDWNNHRIRVFDVDGAIETFAGSGILGDGPEGPALDAAFNHPTNVIFDATGRMWIAAWHNSRVRVVDPATGLLDDVCGTGSRAYAGDGGPAETAVLDLPAGIAFDPEGRLVMVDQANQMLRRIGADGTIERIAGQCLVNEGMAGETPEECPDSNKLAFGIAENPDVCMLPCQPAFGGDEGPALEARFAFPFGQAADPAGRLVIDRAGVIYVADSRNHRVRRIDLDGTVHTVAGNGTPGHGGDGGPASDAQLDNPVDLDIGSDGTLYIADTFNSCVRAVSPEGVIRTVVGVCGMRGDSGDGGPPSEALLDRPYGVDLDRDGNLWVSDTHNHRVRVVMAPF